MCWQTSTKSFYLSIECQYKEEYHEMLSGLVYIFWKEKKINKWGWLWSGRNTAYAATLEDSSSEMFYMQFILPANLNIDNYFLTYINMLKNHIYESVEEPHLCSSLLYIETYRSELIQN